MLKMISMFAIALVLQCTFEANGQIFDRMLKTTEQNKNFAARSRHRLSKYVHIASAPPKTVHPPRGDPLELSCEIFGSPSPTVTWLKNGEVIVDYENESNEILPSYPASIGHLSTKLIIDTPSDGDVYTCLAESGAKQKLASTTVINDNADDLLALEKFIEKPSKPVITVHYNELFQNIGTNVVLPCRVYSSITPKIYWTDNNDNLIFGNPKFTALTSGDLMINNLEWSDMGQYTCNAKNTFGKDSAKTFLYPMKVMNS